LIDLPLTKCSRRIRPIVSTTNIPRHPLAFPKRAACATHSRGGQSWTPITPLLGRIFHAETHGRGPAALASLTGGQWSTAGRGRSGPL
jgi:hypothetical protein